MSHDVRLPRSISIGIFVTLLAITSSSYAQNPNYIMSVGSQGGEPGTSVDLMTTLDSSAGGEIQGITVAQCHPTTLLTLSNVVIGSGLATVNNGQPPSFFTIDMTGIGFSMGCVISLIGQATLPPGVEHELVVASYVILPTAPPGSAPVTLCDFTNPPVIVSVVVSGASLPPTTIDGEVVVGGTIEAFERGDCNSDGMSNIADAIALLGSLFPGANPVVITCSDACDSNDDGSLNIADAIFLLNSLFGVEVIPDPVTCGADPTSGDPLNCDVSGAC